MGLSWVRLDASTSQHDKILALIADPSPKRWQAMSNYFFALGWAAGQGTDGHVPAHALSAIHATTATARLLVKYRLWDEATAGWTIRNFHKRNPQAAALDELSDKRSASGALGNHVRWQHKPGCGCPADPLEA